MNKNILLALLLGLLIVVAAVLYTQPQMILGLFDKQAAKIGLPVTATTTQRESARVVPAASLQPTTRTITKADDGKTISVKKGSTVVLSLGFEKWTIALGGTGIIAQVKNASLVGGSQAVYTAEKEGSTTITATGKTVCDGKTACTPSAVAFSTTVVVTK